MTKQTFFKQFSHIESMSGLLLFLAALAAMIISNSPLQASYHNIINNVNISMGIGSLTMAKPLQYWINDGFMVIFFLLVGLEIKRELVVGELSHLSNALLPLVAALGGMIVPAMIY